MMARHTEAGGSPPSGAPPRCSFRKALAAAEKVKSFGDDEVSGSYQFMNGKGLWIITSVDGDPHHMVDADCRVISVAELAR